MCTGGGIHYRGCTFITGGGCHPPVLHPLQGVYLHCWGCAYQDACVLGVASTTGGVPSLLGVCIPGRMCTGGGIHYRGCTFIAGGVHTRTHVYWGWHPLQGVYLHNWGGAIHYRGCTFIAGGVHTRMHVYWGWHPLQGVYLHCWGCACMCTGGGIHYRGCTFIAGGVHTRTHVYWGWHPLQGVYLHNWGVPSTSAASTTGGVPSLLGVCIPGRMCTGGGIHYRGCWGCAYQDACVCIHYRGCTFTGGVPSTTGGVPSLLGVCIPGRMCTGGGIHYRGCMCIHVGVASTTGGVPSLLGVCIPDACVLGLYLHCNQSKISTHFN